MFFDEQLSKINDVLKVLPYVFICLILWLFVMSIVVFLLYFNIIDIKSIVEAMKQCVVSLNIL